MTRQIVYGQKKSTHHHCKANHYCAQNLKKVCVMYNYFFLYAFIVQIVIKIVFFFVVGYKYKIIVLLMDYKKMPTFNLLNQNQSYWDYVIQCKGSGIGNWDKMYEKEVIYRLEGIQIHCQINVQAVPCRYHKYFFRVIMI